MRPHRNICISPREVVTSLGPDNRGVLRGGRPLPKPHRLALIGLCLLALGCASSDQLTRRSELELRAGHPQKAYEEAKKALRKDRSNEGARAALASAGGLLVRQRQDQILALASAGDTLEAGEGSLRLESFRRDLADFSAGPPPDTAFAEAEHRIRMAAAGIHYRRGREAWDAGAAKRAYDEFRDAHGLVPGFLDVEARIRASYEEALARVAILPFEDQTNVPGLSVAMAERIHAEVGRRITPKEFRFTALLGRDEVNANVPVSALSHLEREDALRIGRNLHADRVVVGRFYGLRSEKNTEDFDITAYRRQLVPVPVRRGGPSLNRVEYQEEKLHVTRLARRVSVSCEFSILDARDGKTLVTRSNTVPAEAIVVWTDYEPVGDCSSYFLYTPDQQKDADAVKAINEQWRRCAGNWKLTAFLERARGEHRHANYRPEDRQAFFGFSSDHPVFLGELPPEGDLAVVALHGAWEPVLTALRELDPK